MMMKTLKVKLSLLIVLAAIMVPALSIPAYADTIDDKILLSGTFGYEQNLLTKASNPDKLTFRASVTTVHKDYEMITLDISYGRPYITNGKSKCDYIGSAHKSLSKNEMDAKGKIDVRLSNSLPANQPYCLSISSSIGESTGFLPDMGVPYRTLDTEARTILWDPRMQFDNWLPVSEQAVISIGYDKGNEKYIRFHGIGKSYNNDLKQYSLRGDLKEVNGPIVDYYYDDAKVKSEIVQWASKKQLSASNKYKLNLTATTNYYDSSKGKDRTNRDSFTLNWSPPSFNAVLVDVPLNL
jgi:hypothetical protein